MTHTTEAAPPKSRRAFLQGLGRVAVGGAAVPSCRTSNAPPATAIAAFDAVADAQTGAADGPSPPVDVSPTVTDAVDGFAALRKSMAGAVLTPSGATASDYAAQRLLYNPRFDHVLPQAIARCTNAKDVSAALLFARAQALPFAVRGGGHSYAGYSTSPGLVIDVRLLNEVEWLATPGHVRLGAGCSLIDMYAALVEKGRMLPAGSGATVGLAGIALGGGYGLSARQFGLLCDRMVAVTVVAADGQILTCSAKDHADLFWACRGGGGGNFGIVTSLVFDAPAIPNEVCWFNMEWPWSQAAAVVDAWQNWAPLAPAAMTSLCHLFAGAPFGEAPVVSVVGQFFGSVAGCKAALQTMLATGTPGKPVIEAESFGKLALIFAGCESLPACHLQPRGKLQRERYQARSHYLTQLLPPAGIAAMVQAIQARHTGKPMGAVLLDAYGGALNQVAPNATAFVHRNILFSAQYIAVGEPTDTAAADAANLAWLDDLFGNVAPYAAMQTYQNYIDAALPDWAARYYGANYAKLQTVKLAYDPQDVFHFAQSVRLPG